MKMKNIWIMDTKEVKEPFLHESDIQKLVAIEWDIHLGSYNIK